MSLITKAISTPNSPISADSVELELVGNYERALNYVQEQSTSPDPIEYDKMIARERFRRLSEEELNHLSCRVKRVFEKNARPLNRAVKETKRWRSALWMGSAGYLVTSFLRKTFNPLKEIGDDTLKRVILSAAAPLACIIGLYGLWKCFQHPKQVANSERILKDAECVKKLIESDLQLVLLEKVSQKVIATPHQNEKPSQDLATGEELSMIASPSEPI